MTDHYSGPEIAVDLDGTLAYYNGWRGNNIIGAPIPAMFFRVQRWIEEGEKVVIFTARADNMNDIKVIKRWLKYHGLPDLDVTNVKRRQFKEMWDDRAVQLETNTGERPGESTG